MKILFLFFLFLTGKTLAQVEDSYFLLSPAQLYDLNQKISHYCTAVYSDHSICEVKDFKEIARTPRVKLSCNFKGSKVKHNDILTCLDVMFSDDDHFSEYVSCEREGNTTKDNAYGCTSSLSLWHNNFAYCHSGIKYPYRIKSQNACEELKNLSYRIDNHISLVFVDFNGEEDFLINEQCKHQRELIFKQSISPRVQCLNYEGFLVYGLENCLIHSHFPMPLKKSILSSLDEELNFLISISERLYRSVKDALYDYQVVYSNTAPEVGLPYPYGHDEILRIDKTAFNPNRKNSFSEYIIALILARACHVNGLPGDIEEQLKQLIHYDDLIEINPYRKELHYILKRERNVHTLNTANLFPLVRTFYHELKKRGQETPNIKEHFLRLMNEFKLNLRRCI